MNIRYSFLTEEQLLALVRRTYHVEGVMLHWEGGLWCLHVDGFVFKEATLRDVALRSLAALLQRAEKARMN